MVYTITWTRAKKRVILKSFAGMVLWASDPKWQWAVGCSVEHLIFWIENPSEYGRKAHKYAGSLRWSVSE